MPVCTEMMNLWYAMTGGNMADVGTEQQYGDTGGLEVIQYSCEISFTNNSSAICFHIIIILKASDVGNRVIPGLPAVLGLNYVFKNRIVQTK